MGRKNSSKSNTIIIEVAHKLVNVVYFTNIKAKLHINKWTYLGYPNACASDMLLSTDFAGLPVNVGVTMYVLSISSVSEVQMVLVTVSSLLWICGYSLTQLYNYAFYCTILLENPIKFMINYSWYSNVKHASRLKQHTCQCDCSTWIVGWIFLEIILFYLLSDFFLHLFYLWNYL